MDLGSQLRNRRCLVTGGLGFIGSNLAVRLVGLGARVHIIDAKSPDMGANLFNIEPVREQVKVDIAEIGDPDAAPLLARAILDCDYAFNVMGQVSHIDSMTNPRADLDANCISHLALLETCRHVNPDVKIVYTSTRQIYGRAGSLPVNEDHALYPTDVNGIHKLAGEWYHRLYGDVYGLRTVVLRLTNTYGPRQLMRHSRQGFIPHFVRLALEGKEIQIYGDGRQRRDFCEVDDAVDAMLMAMTSSTADGCVFNVGGATSATLEEFTQTLLRVTQTGSYRLVPFPPARRAIDIGDFTADYTRIQTVLGWRPKVVLEEGLARMVSYYRRYGSYYW